MSVYQNVTWIRALNYLNQVSELNYLTQIVFKVFKIDKRKRKKSFNDFRKTIGSFKEGPRPRFRSNVMETERNVRSETDAVASTGLKRNFTVPNKLDTVHFNFIGEFSKNFHDEAFVDLADDLVCELWFSPGDVTPSIVEQNGVFINETQNLVHPLQMKLLKITPSLTAVIQNNF